MIERLGPVPFHPSNRKDKQRPQKSFKDAQKKVEKPREVDPEEKKRRQKKNQIEKEENRKEEKGIHNVETKEYQPSPFDPSFHKQVEKKQLSVEDFSFSPDLKTPSIPPSIPPEISSDEDPLPESPQFWQSSANYYNQQRSPSLEERSEPTYKRAAPSHSVNEKKLPEKTKKDKKYTAPLPEKEKKSFKEHLTEKGSKKEKEDKEEKTLSSIRKKPKEAKEELSSHSQKKKEVSQKKFPSSEKKGAPLEKKEPLSSPLPIPHKKLSSFEREDRETPLPQNSLPHEKSFSEKHKKETIKITSTNGTISTQTIPTEIQATASSATTSVSPYLNPSVLPLFEKMVGMVLVMKSQGVTQTEVHLTQDAMQSSPFWGSVITVTKFSTAPYSVNIALSGNTKAVSLFNANLEGLRTSFLSRKDLGFEVNRLETSYRTEKPLFHRKSGAGQGDDGMDSDTGKGKR